MRVHDRRRARRGSVSLPVPALRGREKEPGGAVSVSREPAVKETGKNPGSRKIEENGGPTVPAEPPKNLGHGLLADEHDSIGEKQVHRLKAGGLLDGWKSLRQFFRVAGEELEGLRSCPGANPFHGIPAEGAFPVVDQNPRLCMPSQGASRAGDLPASLFQDTSCREAFSPGRTRRFSFTSYSENIVGGGT